MCVGGVRGCQSKSQVSGNRIFLISTMCAMFALQKKENMFEFFLNLIPVEIPQKLFNNNDC